MVNNKNDTVDIENYKGFKITFDKIQEEFKAEKKSTQQAFTDRSLYQLKGAINQTKTEAVELECYLETGYFHKELSKIKILAFNKETKQFKYKILSCTKKESYDVNKLKDEDLELKKLLPINKDTTLVYELLEKYEEQIRVIEDKQEAQIDLAMKQWSGKVPLKGDEQ